MKVVSKEEEQAHYNRVLEGGFLGGSAGLSLGMLGVWAASRRYPAFRQLTVPFRTFLVTSTGTFGAIVNAERYSNAYQRANNPMSDYRDEAQLTADAIRSQTSGWDRTVDWCRRNRYQIVFASWLASMGVAMAIVNRNKFLTTSQKLVQARVHAQGLTLAVLIATAAFETADARSGKGKWETVKVLDPADPEHKHLIEKKVHIEDYEGQDLWKDMVAAEEHRIATRKANEKKKAEAVAKDSEEKQSS